MTLIPSPKASILLALPLAVLLAACGGGGGGMATTLPAQRRVPEPPGNPSITVLEARVNTARTGLQTLQARETRTLTAIQQGQPPEGKTLEDLQADLAAVRRELTKTQATLISTQAALEDAKEAARKDAEAGEPRAAEERAAAEAEWEAAQVALKVNEMRVNKIEEAKSNAIRGTDILSMGHWMARVCTQNSICYSQFRSMTPLYGAGKIEDQLTTIQRYANRPAKYLPLTGTATFSADNGEGIFIEHNRLGDIIYKSPLNVTTSMIVNYMEESIILEGNIKLKGKFGSSENIRTLSAIPIYSNLRRDSQHSTFQQELSLKDGNDSYTGIYWGAAWDPRIYYDAGGLSNQTQTKTIYFDTIIRNRNDDYYRDRDNDDYYNDYYRDRDDDDYDDDYYRDRDDDDYDDDYYRDRDDDDYDD